jgi:hypothetical protein
MFLQVQWACDYHWVAIAELVYSSISSRRTSWGFHMFGQVHTMLGSLFCSPLTWKTSEYNFYSECRWILHSIQLYLDREVKCTHVWSAWILFSKTTSSKINLHENCGELKKKSLGRTTWSSSSEDSKHSASHESPFYRIW